MTESFFEYFIQFRETGGDITERLKKMSCYQLFEPLAVHFTGGGKDDHESFNYCFFYIIMLYTRDSPHWQRGFEWRENKFAIAETLRIPQDTSMFVDLLELREPYIYETIERYLDFQGSRDWNHLTMLYDLYDELVTSARSKIVNGKGVTDYAQKISNASQAKALLADIAEFEQRIDSAERPLSDAKKEVAKAQGGSRRKSTRFSLKVEDVIQEVKAREDKERKNQKQDEEEAA